MPAESPAQHSTTVAGAARAATRSRPARHRVGRRTKGPLVAALLLAASLFAALGTSGTSVQVSGAVLTANPTRPSSVTTDTIGSPLSFTVTSQAAGEELKLTWNQSASNYTEGYKIYRSPTSGGTYTEVATVMGRTTVTWTDTNADRGANYYRVLAFKVNWLSPVSSAAGSRVLGTPGSVTLTNTGPTAVNITWVPPAGAAQSNVYAATCATDTGVACTDPQIKLATVSGSSYAFDYGQKGTVYWVEIRGVDALGAEGPRQVANKQISTIPEIKPKAYWNNSFYVFGGNELGERTEFFWASTATSVGIERSQDNGSWTTLATDQTYFGGPWFKNRNPAPMIGYDYRYRAKACNVAGCAYSPASGVYRVPYWFGPKLTWWAKGSPAGLFVHSRLAGTAAGGTSDSSFMSYMGTSDKFQFGQCPAFRSCAGTDKSTRFTGPTPGAGYLSRTGSLTPANPGGSSPRTIEFSVKLNGSWFGGVKLVKQYGAAGAAGDFALMTGTGPAQLQWRDGQVFTNSSKLADGQWHMYHLVYDGSTTILFEDGVWMGQLYTAVNTNATADIGLGGYVDEYGIDATWDEWSIYPFAFTVAQVNEHWRARADGD